MRNAYFSIAFVLAVFILIAVDFALVSNYLSALRESYRDWNSAPANFILSDTLFIEGAVLLVSGAVLAGFSLYTNIRPSKQLLAEYVKSALSWETIKEEQDIPPTLKTGWSFSESGLSA